MRSKFILLLLVLAIRCHASPAGWGALSGPVSSGTGNPPVNGYNFYRSIAVTGTMVSGTNANYTVLVSASDPSLRSVSNGGHVSGTNGADVVFTSNSALTGTMKYECESYNPVTGVGLWWVQQPSIQSGSTTTFYVAYGNSSITTPPVSGTSAWDSNFIGVWHLGNGTTLSAADSTANGNNGTLVNGPMATSGKIDGGGLFIKASSQEITVGSSASLLPSNYTTSCWINPASFSNYQNALCVEGGLSAYYGIIIFGNATWESQGLVAGMPSGLNGGTLTSNTWYYLVVSYNSGSTTQALYQNGALVNSGACTPGNTGVVSIGNDASNGRPFDGVIDEVRISNIARTPGWIATDYANQSNPGNIGTPGFLTFGSEQ